jgi:rhodanese-related sulfurtransferase
MSKTDFVRMMTADLPEAPSYFPRDAEINRTGAAALEALPRPKELSPTEVNDLSQKGYVLLDVRPSAAYGNAHIPGALNIALSGQFASWCGTLIGMETPIVLVADDLAAVDEALVRLARVGIESVAGYLGGGMREWDRAQLESKRISQMPVDELYHRRAENEPLQIVDVRRPGEYAAGHVPGAINLTLSHLENDSVKLAPDQPTAVICASGYRSSAATSILERHGFTEVYNIVGGTNGWASAGFPIEKPSDGSPT